MAIRPLITTLGRVIMLPGILLAASCANVALLPPSDSGVLMQRVGDGPAVGVVHLGSVERRVLDAVLHHWVANDVYEYDMTLELRNASGTFEPLDPAVTATLKENQASPQSTAEFTGLKKGVYLVSVTAFGNDGGTAASDTLNSTPATATLDLSTNLSATTSTTVQFDAVPFDASGTAILKAPTRDGQWAAPTASPSVGFGSIG